MIEGFQQKNNETDQPTFYGKMQFRHYELPMEKKGPWNGTVTRWRLVLYFPDTEFHTFFSGQVPISLDIHVVRTFPDMSGARLSCRSWPDCSLLVTVSRWACVVARASGKPGQFAQRYVIIGEFLLICMRECPGNSNYLSVSSGVISPLYEVSKWQLFLWYHVPSSGHFPSL